MKGSTLNLICKEREIRHLRQMTPEQRLIAQARLNARIRELFFAGLRSQGFSGSEIARLWKGK